MRIVRKFATTLWRARRGQDLLEYACVCGFIAAALVSCWGATAVISDRLGAVVQVLVAAIAQLSPAVPAGY